MLASHYYFASGGLCLSVRPSACLSISLCACISRKPHGWTGHGSVFLWRRCDSYVLPVLWITSCFAIMALWRVVCIRKEHDEPTSRDFNQILRNDKTGSTHLELHTRAKSAMYDFHARWLAVAIRYAHSPLLLTVTHVLCMLCGCAGPDCRWRHQSGARSLSRQRRSRDDVWRRPATAVSRLLYFTSSRLSPAIFRRFVVTLLDNFFLARDVYTFTYRAYATMSVSVCLSVCLWRKSIGAL